MKLKSRQKPDDKLNILSELDESVQRVPPMPLKQCIRAGITATECVSHMLRADSLSRQFQLDHQAEKNRRV
jgi:hypothetical protein